MTATHPPTLRKSQQKLQQPESQHIDWKYGKGKVETVQNQSQSTMTNQQQKSQYELQQDDSPGVARARRLLSTMKVQREQAFEHLRSNTGSVLENTKSTNGVQSSTTKPIGTKDVSYYETIHQRLRNRIEQKMALSSSLHERAKPDLQANKMNSSTTKLNGHTLNQNGTIRNLLNSKIGAGDRSRSKQKSYHLDDNNTVSTAQSTICHSITTSSSLSRQSFHSYRLTRNDDSFTTFASQDVIMEDTTNKPTSKKVVSRSIKATAQKIRNPPVQPATEEMIAELTSFLAKCNETKLKRNQSDQSNVTNLKENRESLRELEKSKQLDNSSSEGIMTIAKQIPHTPMPPKNTSTTIEVDMKTSTNKESPVFKEEPKPSSLSTILNTTNCKVSPIRRRQLSPRSQPIIRAQSSHPRGSKREVWRLCNHSQSVRQARSYDEIEFEGTIVQRSTNCITGHDADRNCLLFPSASADDADQIRGPKKRMKQRRGKQTRSTKFLQKPIQKEQSTTVATLKDNLTQKIESKHRSHRENEIQTVLSGGGSTASVTVSSGSSGSEEILTDENDQIPVVTSSSSSSRPFPVSPSLPLHIHSLHNRSNSSATASLYRKDTSSPLRSVRSNSLSPKRVLDSKNSTKKLMTMNDIETPFLVSSGKLRASSSSKLVGRSDDQASGPSKDKIYSTNWFLAAKVGTNNDTPSTTTSSTATPSLETPEERKVFIRDLYRTKPYIVNILPSDIEPSESSMGCQSNGSKGVRSIIAAFQEINTAIQNDMDAPIRIKAEYRSKKQQWDSHNKNQTSADPVLEKETTPGPSIEMNGLQKESTGRIADPSTLGKLVDLAPKMPVESVLEQEGVVLDDESVTLDNAYDEDYESDYTTSSDTSGWISNSSTTFTTLDYDSDQGLPNRSGVGKSKLPAIERAASFPSLDSKKKKKRKDTNKKRGKNQQPEKNDLSSVTAIASLAGSTQSHDESCVDTVSLLSNGMLDEPQPHPSSIKITGLAPKGVPLVSNKEDLKQDRQESFSSFGELQWSDSPKKRRVCFAPDSELEQLEVFQIEDSTFTDDEEAIEDCEEAVVEARLLFIPEDVADDNCVAGGGLYSLALSRSPIVVDNNAELYPIQVRKGKAKKMLYQWSTDFRCGTYGSHFDIACRSGCKVISNKPLRRKAMEKGIVESEAGFIATTGGLYYMALGSGLTKKALHSRESYNVVVNLRVTSKKAKEGQAIPEVISDHRCGATGGWYYLASSIVKIQKRHPLEEDIYMVN